MSVSDANLSGHFMAWVYRNRSVSSACAILLAGIMWGVISIFIRPLAAAGLTSEEMTFGRALFATFFLFLLLMKKNPALFRFHLRDFWIFFCIGCVSLLGFSVTYFYMIASGYTAVGGVLLYTAPAFVLIFSAVFFKEKITGQRLIALLCTLLGCFLVSGAGGNAMSLPVKFLLTGLASGLLYGLYSIFGKIALKRYATETVLFYAFALLMLALAPFEAAAVFKTCVQHPAVMLYFSGVALVCSVGAFFFYTWGLQYVSASTAALVVSVDPLVSSTLGILVYGESAGVARICGITSILIAIILANLPEKKAK